MGDHPNKSIEVNDEDTVISITERSISFNAEAARETLCFFDKAIHQIGHLQHSFSPRKNNTLHLYPPKMDNHFHTNLTKNPNEIPSIPTNSHDNTRFFDTNYSTYANV